MLRWRAMSSQQGLILLLKLNGSRKCKAIVFSCRTITSSRANQWARKLKTNFWAGLSFHMRLRHRLSRLHSATSKTLRGSSSALSSLRTRVTLTLVALARFRTTSWITSPKSQTLQWMKWTRRQRHTLYRVSLYSWSSGETSHTLMWLGSQSSP